MNVLRQAAYPFEPHKPEYDVVLVQAERNAAHKPFIVGTVIVGKTHQTQIMWKGEYDTHAAATLAFNERMRDKQAREYTDPSNRPFHKLPPSPRAYDPTYMPRYSGERIHQNEKEPRS